MCCPVLTSKVLMMAHHVLVALRGAQSHLVDELQGRLERAILGDVEVKPRIPGQGSGISPGNVSCKNYHPITPEPVISCKLNCNEYWNISEQAKLRASETKA
jgi:hypothetical protein